MSESPLIALVEDEEHLAEALLFNLKLEGFRTHHEADGEAALNWLLHTPERSAAVLLDVMLPGIDGFEIPKSDPPRHERLFFERIDGQRACVLHQLISQFHFAEFERPVGKLAALRPPFIENRNLFWVGRNSEDDLGGFFDFAGFAQELRAVKGEACAAVRPQGERAH